jgi:hypothetical protein
MRTGGAVFFLASVLFVAACDPAEFRPAKGAHDLPSTNTAYRVQEDQDACDDIGFVTKAKSVDAVAVTAANHGGTHYRILDDFGHSTVETETAGGYGYGRFHANSSSEVVKHHSFTAHVFRCK